MNSIFQDFNLRAIGKILSTLFIILAIFNQQVFASGNSHYLPLKTDPLIELELEKLATIAKMPILTKPYHAATISTYLKKIALSHPALHRRISHYLNRYKNEMGLTQLNFEVSASNDDNKVLPNSRGQTTTSNASVNFAGHWSILNNLNLSVGGTYYNGDNDKFVPHNTYLSYTHEYFQIDLGYKEHWFSPFQESAMLLSTQAKPIARFSLSSPTPLTNWMIEYDISYGKLEEMDGIRLGDERFSGRPGFLAMHLSFQPFEWWTLGANRTLVFGGGPRKIDVSQIWQAIIDPVSGDNCGGQSSLQNCEDEAGNQQASISSKFDVNWGTPLTINVELAGEDTNDFKPYKLGNKAYNVGVFLPQVTEKSSVLFEYQLIENGWYTHHIYQEGYRNDLNSIGHWWGDEKLLSDPIGAKILTLRYNLEINSDFHFDAKLTTVENLNVGEEAPSDESIYQRGYELTLGLNDISDSKIWRYEIYAGKTVLDERFARISVSYRWK